MPTTPDCSVEPTLTGPGGRAWKVDFSKWTNPGAGLALWIVSAPWAHPIWSNYAISLIHLRDMDGHGPPRLYLPDATHEIIVAALDPESSLDEAVLWGQLKYLSPINFMGQFITDDELAIARTNLAVSEILTMTLSPDTDHTSDWVDRFGDAGLKPEFRRQRQ